MCYLCVTNLNNNMNNFILGPNGFLASSVYNKETNTLDITWVSEIRNAKRFTKKISN